MIEHDLSNIRPNRPSRCETSRSASPFFGTRWGHGADETESAGILNAYAEAGGNFIDTADIYQFGESEEILGRLLRGRREDFVLATCFTNGAAPNPIASSPATAARYWSPQSKLA